MEDGILSNREAIRSFWQRAALTPPCITASLSKKCPDGGENRHPPSEKRPCIYPDSKY